MKDKEKENGKLFRREAEEAAELVTDGSCCPTPFFSQQYKNKMKKITNTISNNTRTRTNITNTISNNTRTK